MSSSDQLVRFLFREKDVRGEIVKVASSLDLMLQNHQYAHPVKQLLAELVAAQPVLVQISAAKRMRDGAERDARVMRTVVVNPSLAPSVRAS